jgi:hypothetical protein
MPAGASPLAPDHDAKLRPPIVAAGRTTSITAQHLNAGKKPRAERELSRATCDPLMRAFEITEDCPLL